MPLRAFSSTSTSRSPSLGPISGRRATGGSAQRSASSSTPSATARPRTQSSTLERHPELDHDEQVWVLFTEQIIRGMGGDSDGLRMCRSR
jgi:hypothetical protein